MRMKVKMKHLKVDLFSPVSLLVVLFFTAGCLASPNAEPQPDASPDLSNVINQDPEDPDFSGVVDFSNAVPGPDGSWCITKVKMIDHMESDQVKECWHQNVTQCHDTYVTEFFPSQEQKCEESFWKSCKIDFKEVPFNYTLKKCHTPLVKHCDDYASPSDYGAPQKTVCRTWFESECNTTFVEQRNGDTKPNTWCQKVPRKICAPDNCNMIQGAQECKDMMMVSTIQKPEEHCELQPQRHCRLITKLTPHLVTQEVCRDIPKEICVLKLVNPHPVKKPIQLKWCTMKKPEKNLPTYSKPASSSYLPPGGNTPPPPLTQYQTIPPPPSYESFSANNQFSPIKRQTLPSEQYQTQSTDTGSQFTLTVDGQPVSDFDEYDFPQQFRQVRDSPHPDDKLPHPNRIVIRGPGNKAEEKPSEHKVHYSEHKPSEHKVQYLKSNKPDLQLSKTIITPPSNLVTNSPTRITLPSSIKIHPSTQNSRVKSIASHGNQNLSPNQKQFTSYPEHKVKSIASHGKNSSPNQKQFTSYPKHIPFIPKHSNHPPPYPKQPPPLRKYSPPHQKHQKHHPPPTYPRRRPHHDMAHSSSDTHIVVSQSTLPPPNTLQSNPKQKPQTPPTEPTTAATSTSQSTTSTASTTTLSVQPPAESTPITTKTSFAGSSLRNYPGSIL